LPHLLKINGSALISRGMVGPDAIAKVHRRRAWVAWLIGGGALVCGTVVLYCFNPVEQRLFPRCMFHVLTGWDCPGCGGLRATHQLLHGNFGAAFRLNPLFVCALPIVAVLFVRSLFRKTTAQEVFNFVRNPKLLWSFAGVVIAFGVLRNLPWKLWIG
jgi:hypothetical protein